MHDGETSTPLALATLTAGYFREKGIDSPRLEAELLLAHALGTTRMGLYLDFDKPLDREEVARYRTLVRRRVRGEPSAYLVGAREFWSLRFEVGPGVLIPRPETERLVEEALGEMGEAGRFLDLGTGSGAIAVALLTERPGWTAAAVEISPEAAAIARRNAEKHGVAGRLDLREGSLFGPVGGERFDLIVSNPPYIPSGEIVALATEVARHEPREALDGGLDGLDLVREILAEAPDRLEEGGRLFVEFGADQGERVRRIAEDSGRYADVEILKDYAGRDRLLRARRA
jgi:release factor glutamine methyltransferase